MSRKLKRGLLFGFTAAAGALVVASTAYACIVYRGDLTLTGASQTSNLMTGDPSASMTYCSGRAPTTAAAGQEGTDVTIDVDPATACTSSSNKLNDRKHLVRINNVKGFTGSDGSSWTIVNGTGCWATSPVQGTALTPDSFTPSGGSYLGTHTLPSTLTANASGEASTFCIGEETPPAGQSRSGMLAPFRVVT